MPAQPSTIRELDIWPLHTQRLVLRPYSEPGPEREDDIDAVFDIRRRDDVSRWISRHVTDRAEMAERVERAADVIVLVTMDGHVIGDVYIETRDGWSQNEVSDDARNAEAVLGWVFHPDWGGRGLATEAVAAAIDVCFSQLQVRRVVAECFADNTRSWRLMERLGMRRESHAVRDSLHRDLGWVDGYTYAVLVDEWADGRADERADTQRRPT